MKIYILREVHWDYSETLGVYSEEGVLHKKKELIQQSVRLRDEAVVNFQIKIDALRAERRKYAIKSQEMVLVEKELKTSGDKEAFKAYRKERKKVLRDIDALGHNIWLLELEMKEVQKLEGEDLINKYSPKLCFEEHEVLDY